jgi:hypothetical protein
VGCEPHLLQPFRPERYELGKARSSEPHPEQTAVVDGICDACLQDVVENVEAAAESLRGNGVGVHGDDVLKSQTLSFLGAELQGFGDLSFVDAVEEMTIVNAGAAETALSDSN